MIIRLNPLRQSLRGNNILKYILTDCDGVLLNWKDAFDSWMMRNHNQWAVGDVEVYDQAIRYDMEVADMKRYVRDFNHSANMGFLAPLYDSVKYVRKLNKEHGYQFVVITSMSKDIYAQKLRTDNLENIFGKHVFKEFVYLDTGADKTEVLTEYSAYYPDAYWIEDKIENAEVGLDVGLRSMLVKHIYNNKRLHDVPVYSSWKDIYKKITQDL